jgi:hypothetical protein
VTVELQGQLLAQERELDSREGDIDAWEEGLAAFAHMLGEVHVERDASHASVDVVQQVFFTQAHASVPDLDSSPTLAGCWKNAIFFFACKRKTWRCGR